MDKLINDPVYAAHNKAVCEFPILIAGVSMEDTPQLRSLFNYKKNGKFTGLGYFSHGNDDEWIFGYVVLAITPDGFRWRPPPTLLADVEAGLSELMGDLKQDPVELFLDVDWRNVHLGDCVEDPFWRGDLPGIDWTVTPPHTLPAGMDEDDFEDSFFLVRGVDGRAHPCAPFKPNPAYLDLLPPCWDHSLEVFSLPYQAGEDCCLVGKNLNKNGCTIEMPSPEDFDVMDAKLKTSLGNGFGAYLVGV